MDSLYNFDPNRNLGFDAGRGLDFNVGRALDFRPSRDLDFMANRDLGFGAKGVVFREAPRDEAVAPTELPTKPAVVPTDAPRALAGNRFCPYCGVALRAGDEVCWNCRSRVTGGWQVTRMPAKAARPVSRAWRGAGEG